MAGLLQARRSSPTLDAIAKKCNDKVNKDKGYTKAKPPKGAVCRKLGTFKHKCCSDELKKKGFTNVQSEKSFSKRHADVQRPLPARRHRHQQRRPQGPRLQVQLRTKSADAEGVSTRRRSSRTLGPPRLVVRNPPMSIPRVLVKDDDDEILVRDCMLSAFFSTQPYSKLAKAAGKIFEDWMKRFPPTPRSGRVSGRTRTRTSR